jgi:hypothetical protein
LSIITAVTPWLFGGVTDHLELAVPARTGSTHSGAYGHQVLAPQQPVGRPHRGVDPVGDGAAVEPLGARGRHGPQGPSELGLAQPAARRPRRSARAAAARPASSSRAPAIQPASRSVGSMPSSAAAMAGASSSPSGREPNRPSAASHPATQPGTVTESGPRAGTASSPRARRPPRSPAAAPARRR